ncbi:MAG: hypothetical protein NC908_00750 [Candidatus Omnitrophica bacterium]|nr:hypothetical protein [Candidatus Omnitrophota bacterium]
MTAQNNLDLLERLQKNYRNYNLSLLAYFILLLGYFNLIFFIHTTGMTHLVDTDIFRVFELIRLFSFILVLVYVYRLGKILKSNNRDKTPAFLWVIIMVLPIVNLIAILLLYHKSRKFIKELKTAGDVS